MGRKILFDGKITFSDCINIKLDSPALNYGLGLFETVLYENGKIYFLDEHIRRLTGSCIKLKLPVPDAESVNKASVLELIESDGYKNACRIKIMYAPLLNKIKWNLTVTTSDYIRNTEPVSAVIENNQRENAFNRHKTISYMQNYLLSDPDPDIETLFINSKGNIIEGTRSNLLCVKDDILYYVNDHENYLKGIMQSKIVSDCKNFGLRSASAIKNGIPVDFIIQCSEVIITNSLIIAKNVGSLKLDKEVITFKTLELSEKIRKFYLK